MSPPSPVHKAKLLRTDSDNQTRSGYTVLTTCSPANFEYVKSLGASEAFDYRDPESAAKIRSLTNNALTLAWDTIGEADSAQFCADALSTDSALSPKRYGTILQSKCPRDDVETVGTLMYTIFGEEFAKFGATFPACAEDFEFAKSFMAMTEKLLAEGKLKTHAEAVGKGGLQGALQGMEDMKAGKVSGKKLVYRVAETA